MRKYAFPGLLAAIAMVSAVLSSDPASADSPYTGDDFSALLAKVNYQNADDGHAAVGLPAVLDAGPAIAAPATAPSPEMLPQTMELPAESTVSAPAAPQTQPIPQAQSYAEVETVSAPTENPYVTDSGYGGEVVDGCSTCQDESKSCDRGCGGCKGGVCQPYERPVLPSSSFYQYWRSNACNTKVWDGYRNRCSSANIHTLGQCDCFEPKKKLFGSCRKRACGIVHPVDCGPAPECWEQNACDSCDGN